MSAPVSTPKAIVIGGGIGGLAAALALARQGLRVHVLEQSRELGEIGAGIQLGPNAFHAFDALGIGPAARHWFGKDARVLSPKEAAFLASVIPSPVRYHAALFSRGAPPAAWELTVRAALHTRAQQGSLTEAQLSEALAEPVPFASAASGAADGPGSATAQEPAPAAAP